MVSYPGTRYLIESMTRQSQLVKEELPVVISPGSPDESDMQTLLEFVDQYRSMLDNHLITTGAILFRGYAIDQPEDFSTLSRHLIGELKPYLGGDSPRTSILKNIYTSTDFPPHKEIFLHNELTYTGWWPSRVGFWCNVAPETGGQTQIADSRAVYWEIDPEVRARFEEKGVLYTRSYHTEGGVGKSWQETFETENRNEVEQLCESQNVKTEWHHWGLRTLTYGSGVLVHPVTGETSWTNQADQLHAEFLTPWEDKFNAEDFDETQLPFHAYFGDGSPIDLDDLVEIRRACAVHEVMFDWQHGDFLVLDNLLTKHGRKPFTGDRQILVAMG